jgi:hypothetical protein
VIPLNWSPPGHEIYLMAIKRKNDSGLTPAKRQKLGSQALVLRQPGQGMVERPVVPRGFLLFAF